MAVLRQEINASIGTKDTRSIASPQLQDARFKPEQTTNVVEDNSWRTNMVSSIVDNVVGTAIKVGEKLVGVAQENAYLEGQAQAGRIKSEEELESNWLTKDWKVAGYRDTMGKLSLADSEAKMRTKMQELRTEGPEKMAEYLSQRRNELTPVFASLSREARANMFGQLLMSDRAAMTTHAGEHKAYILDTAQKGIRGVNTSTLTTLNDMQLAAQLGKISPEEYSTAVKNYAVGLETSVWRNPMFKFEPGIKSKLTAEAIQTALDNDHLSVYEYYRDNVFQGIDGGPSRSVLSELDEGAAMKLGKAYLEAKGRTKSQREGALITQTAQTEAQIANGTYTGTWEEYSKILDHNVAAKLYDADKRAAAEQKYFQMAGKHNDLEGQAAAARNHDSAYFTNANITPQQGWEAQEKLWSKQAQAGKPVGIMEQLGVFRYAAERGSEEAQKRMGAKVGMSIAALSRSDGQIDAQHAEVLNVFNQMYETSNPHQRAYMTAGIPQAQQDRYLMLREAMRDGSTMDIALPKVMAIEANNSKMTAQERATASLVTQAEINKEVQDFESQGFLMSLKNKLIPTERNQAKGVLQPSDMLWGNNTRVEDTANKMRSEIIMEANELRRISPSLSAESLVNKAAGAVASRTLRMPDGPPLFLPRGMEPAKYFGEGKDQYKNLPNEVYAKAVNTIIKPQVAGNTVQYEVALGGVAWVEVDRDGKETTRKGVLQPKAVQSQLDVMIESSVKQSSEIHGKGKTVRHDTASVTFNGENAAGVDPELMYQFRDTLVKHEGVRNTVYKDLSNNINKSTGKPVQTVGVGVSDTNPHFPKIGPDGKIDQASIDTSFRKASNDAAIFGARAVQQLGLSESKSAFLLFSEFAYQGTGSQQGKEKAFPRMAQAIASKDKEAALAALKETKAYDYSQPARKAHYEKMVLAALEGK